MIKLQDVVLLDGLPKIIRERPEVMALSSAVERVQRSEIWPRIAKLKIYPDIDAASENVLDALAQELQVPAYREDYDITVKRQLVKSAIPFWVTAGSAQVVEDLCKTIFGDAEVVEWWTSGSAVGTYKVRTTNPGINSENIAEFEKVAESVKRLSQHLVSIDLELSVSGEIHVGGFVMTGTTSTIKEEGR